MHSEIAFYRGNTTAILRFRETAGAEPRQRGENEKDAAGVIIVALLGANGRDDQNFVRVGKEWMSVEEYRRRYVDNKDAKPEPPCKDTLRCPQALDVFCEECQK